MPAPAASRTSTLPIILLVLCFALAAPAYAQTYTVLQSFGGINGDLPGTPALDKAGNIYGSTLSGGPGEFGGFGNVYKLAHVGSGWVLENLYNFTAGNDGAYPLGGPTFGADGALYGTASGEGQGGGGTVYKLQPPSTFCRSVTCPWNITVLYSFLGGTDGNSPYGNVVFDAAGNMYGTTSYGGTNNLGTVWELSHVGGAWTESVLYSFHGSDGSRPTSSVILDSAGNLYGITNAGGPNGWGEVYELTHSGSGWTLQVLHSFQNQNDGRSPYGGLVFDSAGNLYGSSASNGQNFGGVIFQLSPSNGGWTFNPLYSLSGRMGPEASLTVDASGNLYGTTYMDGVDNDGSVFELSPSSGGWVYTDLHDFTNGKDGENPSAAVVLGANGNLFGAAYGGTFEEGVVFEIAR